MTTRTGPAAADDGTGGPAAPVITRLLLLGATGDMAGRFLLPALATLQAEGRLPTSVRVVGAGAEDWDDARFRSHVDGRLGEHAPDVPADLRASLVEGLRYRRVDLEDPAGLAAALRTFDAPSAPSAPSAPAAEPVAVYLALPSRWFRPAVRSLTAVGLPPGSRVAVEKPFGEDLATAAELNALLARVGDGTPGSVSRVDHILGMPRVEDLQRLRGPGGALEALWDGAHLERVEILWEEILGLEGRTDFYDRTGTVRDVLQNHLLQVLALVALEPPPSPSEEDLHRAKAAALAAVTVALATPSGAPSETPTDAPTDADVAGGTRRARYTAGTLVGPDGAARHPVAGYAAADGVDPARGTETFAELVLRVGTPRWTGTRFVLRTGKAMATNRKGVALHLRAGVPAGAVEAAAATPGVERVAERVLWLELDGPRRSAGRPEVQVNAPGELSAYQRVLGDVLTGGRRTSVGADEAETSWRIVDPVLRAWRAGVVPLEEYPAGSAGPAPVG